MATFSHHTSNDQLTMKASDAENIERTKSKGRISIRAESKESLQEVEADADDWSNIIFLPFHPYWEFFLMCSILFNFIMNWNDIVYDFNMEAIDWVYYTFEMVYFVDTVIMIIHR